MTITACCGSAAVGGCRGSTTGATCCASTAAADCRGSVVVATCCGPTTAAAPRESSLAAAVVPAVARDALDEGRLVGTAASDLSTLAGARGPRWAPPYEREDKKVRSSLISKTRCVGERSPTSRWRTLASSSSGAQQTLWPSPGPRSSQRRALAPPRRASPHP
jgi:hypothetical protein